ncbi:Protein W03C9.6, partial [Aphelenchoides avenae]
MEECFKRGSGEKKTLAIRLCGEGCTGFDWLAVLVIWLTKIVFGILMLIFQNVTAPYSMMAFGWTSAEMLFYQSIMMGIIGVMIILLNIGYIFFNMRKWLHERTGCVVSLSIFLASFLLTFPYPFLSQKISDRAPQCTQKFAWCATTPAANMILYFVAFCFAMGTANPLIQINLDTLYSKVLGPIPQGTMQAASTVGADVIAIFGPIIAS